MVNGNVNHWRITHNRIHDNNNIGIDAIGFEPTLSGPARYSRANRARNGVIADNVIRNIISRGNPAYFEDGGWCNCADGIYIDGGTGIRVERNQVVGNDIGIEVAAENAPRCRRPRRGGRQLHHPQRVRRDRDRRLLRR